MESIITLNSNKPTFKNTALNQATETIYKTVSKYTTADASFRKVQAMTQKAIAAELALIEADKLYKDDGFKSLAEYAECIGLDKSLTHKLENAGRLLNSKNDTVRDFAGKADWSKLAIMASADEADVESAIKEGKLTETTTQREVQDWKRAVDDSKPKSGKVLPKYSIDLTIFDRHGAKDYHFDAIEVENVEQLDGFKLSSYKDDKGGVTYFGIHADGRMCRFAKERVKASKASPVIDITKLPNEVIQQIIKEYAAKNG